MNQGMNRRNEPDYRGGFSDEEDQDVLAGGFGESNVGVHERDSARGGAIAGGRRVGPKGYQRSDERIREAVCERLIACRLPVHDVEVGVAAAVVTLTGSVRDRAVKFRIEEIADDTYGVTDVDNRLRVGAGPVARALDPSREPARPGSTGGGGISGLSISSATTEGTSGTGSDGVSGGRDRD